MTINTPRNGTSTHTVDPATSGTVAAGSAFTPTAGRFLVCIAEGGVTSTTPAGWTLPSGGSAINNTGLYVWWIDAVGGDTITTTHNGSNYPVVFDFYEFESDSIFLGSAAATGVSANGGAGPTLSGLTDIHWDAGIVGQDNPITVDSVTWDDGVEQVDTSVDAAAGTNGYTYSLTAIEDSAAASQDFAATSTDSGGPTVERLVIALNLDSTANEGQGPLWRARVYVS